MAVLLQDSDGFAPFGIVFCFQSHCNHTPSIGFALSQHLHYCAFSKKDPKTNFQKGAQSTRVRTAGTHLRFQSLECLKASNKNRLGCASMRVSGECGLLTSASLLALTIMSTGRLGRKLAETLGAACRAAWAQGRAGPDVHSPRGISRAGVGRFSTQPSMHMIEHRGPKGFHHVHWLHSRTCVLPVTCLERSCRGWRSLAQSGETPDDHQ